jgi:predicted dehydrogenase
MRIKVVYHTFIDTKRKSGYYEEKKGFFFTERIVMKKIKIGVIGAGAIAQEGHLKSFSKLDGVSIEAIADPNEMKLRAVAERFQIPRVFPRWEDLVNCDDIDGVVVCSPNAFHALHSKSAMKAGKDVLYEKPVAITSSEIKEVLQIATETGKIFMGAFCQRFRPHAVLLKKMISSGDLGEIYYAKVSYLRRRGIPGLGSWFTSKKLAGGGALLDVGVHMLDLVIYLMGCPKPMNVLGTTYSKFQDQAVDGGWPPMDTRIGDKNDGLFDVEELASALVTFQDNRSLFVEASWAGNSETGLRLSLFGTKAGALYSSTDTPSLKIFGEVGGVLSDTVPLLPEGKDVFLAEAEHFVECIRSRTLPITTPDEILTDVKILEAIYASAEKKQAVTLEE